MCVGHGHIWKAVNSRSHPPPPPPPPADVGLRNRPPTRLAASERTGGTLYTSRYIGLLSSAEDNLLTKKILGFKREKRETTDIHELHHVLPVVAVRWTFCHCIHWPAAVSDRTSRTRPRPSPSTTRPSTPANQRQLLLRAGSLVGLLFDWRRSVATRATWRHWSTSASS